MVYSLLLLLLLLLMVVMITQIAKELYQNTLNTYFGTF